MARITRLLLDSRLHVAWAAFVVLALTVTYFGDPFVFGFTTLGLAWASAAMTVLGVVAVIFPLDRSRRSRLSIAAGILAADCSIAIALITLRSFTWS